MSCSRRDLLLEINFLLLLGYFLLWRSKIPASEHSYPGLFFSVPETRATWTLEQELHC
ncbi:hypothetical protein Pint_04605 [Pistacia integerrima]|uniref:Uncharacterized protein n=1 Tax=Pistacia integerrima TaxID=434235 RepID=A0ACC0Z6V9_9ROSI|nr:hypothetical protein Pint_04605 [Pistacia integerrima]